MTDTATPRRRIHLLPDGLINKIAAGEVVERPASVVKELLENAIDAGATRLAIAIEDGGRTLIRIADNGCGISPEEVRLAFAQHATSKINSPDDLYAISTMGFRGEALASIASVSHATLITRTADQPMAVKLEVRDSQLGDVIPIAAAVGTTLEVRDLFYSVPARRKFLRSDSAEFGHIHEMVLRIALPNPHVAISLTHNGRSVLELPSTHDHKLRVSESLGRELHNLLLPVHFSERGVSVQGYIGAPSTARSTAKYQYLFLNGRYIRDRSLLHAVKEAYRGLIEPTAQPVAVLMITMDPVTFDVNVHPQKTEVRFRDASGPYRSVLAAIREQLLSQDLTPSVRVPTRDVQPPAPTFTPPPPAEETRQIIADFFKQTPSVQPRLAYGVEAPGIGDRVSGIGRGTPVSTPAFVEPPAVTNHEPRTTDHQPPSPITDTPYPIPDLPPGPFVQLHNTYIVAQTPDGLIIIDQHALHERIMYEELFTRMTRGPLESQRLLLPEIFSVTPKQEAALESVRPLLIKMGIEIAPFDRQSMAVQSFPSLLSKLNPREFVQDMLDKLIDLGPRLTQEELLHELLDMASCKAAIKANDPLSHDEIAALLALKDDVDRRSNCPHGRPTTLRLTIHDLEKQFKRK